MADTTVQLPAPAASRPLRFSARLAIGFGIFLAIAEVARNWGDWGFWPFWVVDYIAVALLLFGGWRALRARPKWSATPLCGGWGFTCAMFYMSFFSHVQRIHELDHGPTDHLSLTIAIGVLFGITIVGFTLSLAPTAEAS